MWILLNILFLSSVSGSGYILVKDKQLTWEKADAYCKKEYKTRLATIRNDKDAKALLTKAQSNVSPHPFGEVWIGLNGTCAFSLMFVPMIKRKMDIGYFQMALDVLQL
eukprot:681032_1